MKFLANLTLARKIILLIAAGLLVGIGAFSYLGMRAVNQAIEAMLQDRLTTARLTADYVDEALGRALDELHNTALTVGNDGNAANIPPQMSALETTYSRLSIRTNSAYMLSRDGSILWSNPNMGVKTIDLAGYPSIKESVDTGQSTISGLVAAPVTGVPAVLLTSPTKDDNQGNLLVVAIDIAQSSIGGFVQPIRLGQTGYVEIVDQSGIVVARTEPGPKLSAFEKSDHSGRFAALITAGEPTRGLCHTCHEPEAKVQRKDVLAFVPLSQAKWGAVIRQSEDEALSPVRQFRLSLLLSGGGLAIVALLVSFMITRDVAGRLNTLTTASQKIADGDLVSPVDSERGDEIGMLGRSLDDMRRHLRASYEELQQKTKELSSLLSVSEVLSALSDLSNLNSALETALDKTLEIMNTDVGAILILDPETNQLSFRTYRGLTEKFVQEMRINLGEGLAGKAAESGQTMFTDDISAEPAAAHPELVAADGLRAFVSVPLRSKGKILGVINIATRDNRKFTPHDIRLLEGIASQIATAIENARLHQEIQRKDEIRGELLSELLSIQEEERRRIARELHDETSQVLAGITANLEATAGMLPVDKDKAMVTLRKAQALSVNILDEVHKMIYELRPTLLDDLGLVAAAKWLIDNNLKPAGVKANFKTVGRAKRLPPAVESSLFRVIQEAVNNIARHGQAKNASVTIRFKKSGVDVNVKDDGQGFDVEEAMNSKERPRGLGLLGMKERVELMKGTLHIQSQPGAGTEIDVEIPLDGRKSNGQD